MPQRLEPVERPLLQRDENLGVVTALEGHASNRQRACDRLEGFDGNGDADHYLFRLPLARQSPRLCDLIWGHLSLQAITSVRGGGPAVSGRQTEPHVRDSKVTGNALTSDVHRAKTIFRRCIALIGGLAVPSNP